MDKLDYKIINSLQDDFPICQAPFAALAADFDVSEALLMERVQALLDQGTLSRFGPLYNVEQFGGQYSLIAMQVPATELETVIKVINSYPEVAHNYERDHRFNLWFVLACESRERLPEILDEIQQKTGHRTYDMPKLEEFYIGLKLDA